ncbi:MAG: hypothetical protein AB8B82_09730 [Roseovarius sp.]
MIVNESELGLVGGDAGNDTIYGGSDGDVIGGGIGDDSIFGGPGNDGLNGHEGADYINGGEGNDVLAGTYTNGPNSNDLGTGIDTLDGGPGDDILIMNRGEIGIGGDGNDSFSVAGTGSLETPVAHITDFEPGIDSLEVKYQFQEGIEPTVSVSYDDLSDTTNVYLDGDLLATIVGDAGLTPEMIEMSEQYY